MKKLFTKKLLLAAIMMVAGAMNLMAAKGDKFTAMTKEGVEMTFEVLNEEKKECMVAGDYDHTCIDRDVTGTVTIPETAMGYKVTWISQYAFSYCSIWSVVIPQTVTGLGPYAFANCEDLIRCYLPDAMEYIYSGTFMGCKSLDEVYIPHHVKSIEHDAFHYCYYLKSIVIPASVTFIGAYAFSGDNALTTLQLNKTTKLSKAGVKNALKASSVKTVKVKKSKVKKYKKIFKAKNCGKKVKVKK